VKTRIDVPAAEFREALSEAGWLVESVMEGEQWWCREWWCLQSVWSPQTARSFVFFLVDPEDMTAQQPIYAVSASLVPPDQAIGRGSNEHTLYFRRGWTAEIPKFVSYLATLREHQRDR
jgi:hypothetical protein